MEHEFSEGFIHDIGFLMEQCVIDDTDNCELTFEINMSCEEMIKALEEKGYSVYPPLTDKQDYDADRCAESGCGDCSMCSCFVCRAGID